MSLSRLRTFIEVYRQRSISSASRMLNLTQPAVSQHIAGLEVAIGHPLFERLATGVTPTAAADQLAADIGIWKVCQSPSKLFEIRQKSFSLPQVKRLMNCLSCAAARNAAEGATTRS